MDVGAACGRPGGRAIPRPVTSCFALRTVYSARHVAMCNSKVSVLCTVAGF